MTLSFPARQRQSVADQLPVKARPARMRVSVVRCVLRALVRTGLSQGELADVLKMSPSQWAKQKAGAAGNVLSLQRLDLELPADIHAVFVDALVDELARALGKRVVAPAGHLLQVANALRATSDALESIAGGPQPSLFEETGS